MSSPRIALLAVHLTVLLWGLVLFAVAMSGDDEVVGANIGAGIALLFLMVLGLPWTLPLFTGGQDLSGPGWLAVVVGLAVLNLTAHAIVPTVVAAVGRRSRPSRHHG